MPILTSGGERASDGSSGSYDLTGLIAAEKRNYLNELFHIDIQISKTDVRVSISYE